MNDHALVLTAVVGVALGGGAHQARAQPSGVPPTAHQRTADEIRTLIGTAGITSYGITTGHVGFTAWIAADGTLTTRSGAMTDHGKWWIKSDGHFCTKNGTFNYGQETCVLQYVNGNDTYSVQDGILVNVTHKRVPGNPEHL
jgi:hypothetical protein